MKKKAFAAATAKALELHRSGLSTREIAARVKFSHVTVARWIKLAADEAPPLPPAPPSEPPPEVDDLPDDPIERLGYLITESHANAREARAAGNSASCQKSLRDAAAFENILARVRKQAHADEDTFHVSKQQIDEGIREVKEKFGVLAARPGLLCAKCSCELSGAWAGYSPAAIARMQESGR